MPKRTSFFVGSARINEQMSLVYQGIFLSLVVFVKR